MPTRRVLLASAALALALSSVARAQEPLDVVASFSILGDLAAEVGGERVALTTLVGPDGDAHVYQPSPADARAVAAADLVIVNGLEFEGWIDRLIEASGYAGPVIVASDGITPLAFDGDDHDHDHDDHDDDHDHDHDDHDDDHDHDDHADHDHDHDHAGHHHHHGAFDPHAWQSATNAKVYVANIAAALSAADPAGEALYAANAEAYSAELDALHEDILAGVAALPENRRTVVTSHDAFGYFADAYGLSFVAPQGLSTEAEASAGDVARLIEQIRAEGIAAVFVENIADPRLVQQIAAETGAKVGGTLYSDALSGPDGDAPSYILMMRHNLTQLTTALAE